MSKSVHQVTRASPGDRPGPQIHCTPLAPACSSAPGTLHRPPEASRDGPRAMPGPKIGFRSVSNWVPNQVRGLNSGRKTRSRTSGTVRRGKVETTCAAIRDIKINAPTLAVFFFGVGASGRRPGSPPTPRGVRRGGKVRRTIVERVLWSIQ